MLTWIGFFVSISALFLISKKNLGLAIGTAGIILGAFTLPVSHIAKIIFLTLTDPSVLFLALAMVIIPIIGGVLEKSGGLDDIVNNLRIGKKPFLALTPALVGMLPMPGGALLSAPLVEKAGEGDNAAIKAALNVWFRHIPFLIYPLAPTLIISAKIAGLQIYEVIPYLFPMFLLSIFLGYFFFLRKTKGKLVYKEKFSFKKLSLPLGVILLAPLIDFSLQRIFKFEIIEITIFLAVLSSLVLALVSSKIKLVEVKDICKQMKPWNFALIVIGMFVFSNIFKESGVGELIAALSLSKTLLCVIIGFGLGFVTGRVQIPISIIIPIFLGTFSLDSMAPHSFAITFFAVLLGYIVSPVHPCVSISIEYFNVRLNSFLWKMALPIFIGLSTMIILGLFFL